MKGTIIFTTIVALGAFVSCYKEKAQATDCEIMTVSYSEDIVPIIQASCKTPNGESGCHGDWIDSYGAIRSKIKEGSWGNRVFDVKDMPEIPNDFFIDSLNEQEFFVMKCWIEQGYRDN